MTMKIEAVKKYVGPVALALALGCGADERDEITPGPGGGADDGGDDGGGDPGDDGGGDDGGDDGGEDTGDDGGDDGDDGDPGGDEPDVGGGDEGGDGDDGSCTPPDLTDCSIVANNPKAFAQWVNDTRDQYGGAPPYGYHTRWKGMPWEGEDHSNNTFPWHFTWDDDLACQAQQEAERIAAGGSPEGQRADHQSYYVDPPRPFFVHGLNTENWRLSAKELRNDEWFPLDQGNGSARMGLFYHDFGGDGPAINRVGVGAAIVGDCTEIWWVLQFAP
jgi:hypothetical protein